MRTSKYSEEQIIGFLRQAEAGMPVKEIGRKHGFSDARFYKWRAKYGGIDVSEAKRESLSIMVHHHNLSERHACALVALNRDSYRNVTQPSAFNT